MTWLTQDPLFKLRNLEALRKNPGRPKGLVIRIRQKTWLRYQADAERDARKIMKHMVEHKTWVPDNDVAAEAMKEVITVIRTKGLSAKEKIMAAKLMLEFTQRKPVQESDVNINSAEAFLEGILVDVKKERDQMTHAERMKRIEYTTVEPEPIAGPEDAEGQLRALCETRPEDQNEG